MRKITHFASPAELSKKCYIIDASDKILGRLATKIATIIRGKHKRLYTPHVDSGDIVVVINAEKVRVTGKKMTDKIYTKFTGYPSGLRSVRLEEMLAKRPEQVLRIAVSKMIPKGKLGDKVRKNVKIYAGDKHPHAAQQPIPLEV